MHTTAKSEEIPSKKENNLGFLLHNYIKITEKLYPGILRQLAENALHQEASSDATQDQDASKKYNIGGRLFLGLEPSTPGNTTSKELAHHQTLIDNEMAGPTHKAFFQKFHKFIDAIPLHLTLETISSLLEKPAEVARTLLSTKYIARLDQRLRKKIPDDRIRNKAIDLIYDAIFFRCLTYTFAHITARTKSGKIKKTNKMKFRQKFLTEVYGCKSDTANNALFIMEAKIGRTVDHQLTTAYFAKVSLEKEEKAQRKKAMHETPNEKPSQEQNEAISNEVTGKPISEAADSKTISEPPASEATTDEAISELASETAGDETISEPTSNEAVNEPASKIPTKKERKKPKKSHSKKITLPEHIQSLSTFIENLNSHYEFIVCPSATLASLLKHFIALTAHLQRIRFKLEIKNEMQRLSSIIIHCLETHLPTIKQNNQNLLRADSLILTLKKFSLTHEVEKLKKLQKKITPDLHKNLPTMKKSFSDDSQPKKPARAPLPTSPSIANIGFFVPPMKKSMSAPESTPPRTKTPT